MTMRMTTRNISRDIHATFSGHALSGPLPQSRAFQCGPLPQGNSTFQCGHLPLARFRNFLPSGPLPQRCRAFLCRLLPQLDASPESSDTVSHWRVLPSVGNARLSTNTVRAFAGHATSDLFDESTEEDEILQRRFQEEKHVDLRSEPDYSLDVLACDRDEGDVNSQNLAFELLHGKHSSSQDPCRVIGIDCHRLVFG